MLIAYFDESGLSGSDDFFAVSAMIGSVEDWREVDERWRQALAANNAPYLHMREFAHRIDAFRNWSEAQRRALMRACLNAIHSRPIAPIATAMNATSERWVDKHGKETKLGLWFRKFWRMDSGNSGRLI
jgi:hypothetical protein